MNHPYLHDLVAGMQYLAHKDKDGRMSVDGDVLLDWVVGSPPRIDRQGVIDALERLEAAGKIELDRTSNTVHVNISES